MSIDILLTNLTRRGFLAKYMRSGDEILKYLTDNIPDGEDIGFGGSVTLSQLDIAQNLAKKGYTCNSTDTSLIDWEQLCLINRQVKYYISGTNAISQDGILVNIDGRSNRVSAMCYGPEELFIIVGTNKITKDLHSAIDRAQNIAAPLNAKRLNRKTPCVVTGKCHNCNSPDTICKSMLLLYHPTSTIKTHILIIDKELGY